MKFDFLNLKKSVQSIGENLRALRENSETLKRQRDELLAAPWARQDAIAIANAQIEAQAVKYGKTFEAALRPVLRKGANPLDLHAIPLLTATPPDATSTPRTIEQAFSFLFPDLMKKAFAAQLESMEWPENAISASDRAKRLQQLDEEITRLEEEEAELVKQANAAGVILS